MAGKGTPATTPTRGVWPRKKVFTALPPQLRCGCNCGSPDQGGTWASTAGYNVSRCGLFPSPAGAAEPVPQPVPQPGCCSPAGSPARFPSPAFDQDPRWPALFPSPADCTPSPRIQDGRPSCPAAVQSCHVAQPIAMPVPSSIVNTHSSTAQTRPLELCSKASRHLPALPFTSVLGWANDFIRDIS